MQPALHAAWVAAPPTRAFEQVQLEALQTQPGGGTGAPGFQQDITSALVLSEPLSPFSQHAFGGEWLAPARMPARQFGVRSHRAQHRAWRVASGGGSSWSRSGSSWGSWPSASVSLEQFSAV